MFPSFAPVTPSIDPKLQGVVIDVPINNLGDKFCLENEYDPAPLPLAAPAGLSPALAPQPELPADIEPDKNGDTSDTATSTVASSSPSTDIRWIISALLTSLLALAVVTLSRRRQRNRQGQREQIDNRGGDSIHPRRPNVGVQENNMLSSLSQHP